MCRNILIEPKNRNVSKYFNQTKNRNVSKYFNQTKNRNVSKYFNRTKKTGMCRNTLIKPKTGMCRHILIKLAATKFHKHPIGESGTVAFVTSMKKCKPKVSWLGQCNNFWLALRTDRYYPLQGSQIQRSYTGPNAFPRFAILSSASSNSAGISISSIVRHNHKSSFHLLLWP
jgi:hypothetical protein